MQWFRYCCLNIRIMLKVLNHIRTYVHMYMYHAQSTHIRTYVHNAHVHVCACNINKIKYQLSGDICRAPAGALQISGVSILLYIHMCMHACMYIVISSACMCYICACLCVCVYVGTYNYVIPAHAKKENQNIYVRIMCWWSTLHTYIITEYVIPGPIFWEQGATNWYQTLNFVNMDYNNNDVFNFDKYDITYNHQVRNLHMQWWCNFTVAT